MNPIKRSRRVLRPEERKPGPECNRCVRYLRESTDKQTLNFGSQREICLRFEAMKQWTCGLEIMDPGTDGKSLFLARPRVQEMLRFMEQEGIAHIVCSRYSRLFRAPGDGILTVERLLRAGVLVHSAEQNFDLSVPSNRACFGVMNVFATLETELRQQLQLEAVDQQRKLGHRSGVNCPYAWRAVPAAGGRRTRERNAASDLCPIPAQQLVLGDMVRRERHGESHYAIAATLNAAGIPSQKAGQMIRYRKRLVPCKGVWTEHTVFSVLSFARLADPRLASDNRDEVEDAMVAVTLMAQEYPTLAAA